MTFYKINTTEGRRLMKACKKNTSKERSWKTHQKNNRRSYLNESKKKKDKKYTRRVTEGRTFMKAKKKKDKKYTRRVGRTLMKAKKGNVKAND